MAAWCAAPPMAIRNAQALAVLVRIADWVDEAARPVDEPRFQKMLDLEHGGMSEVLADPHTLTGETRYLRLAERFSHQAAPPGLVPMAPASMGRSGAALARWCST